MDKVSGYNRTTKLNIIIISLVILISIGICAFVVDLGIMLPAIVIAVSCLIAVQISFIKNPKSIIWVLIFYIFTFVFFTRELGGGPFGMLQEGILLLGWLTLIFTADRHNWNVLNNDLVILFLIWFIISVLEIANPAGASIQGWLQEIRAAALYPILVVAVGFLVLKKNRDLNTFFYLIIGLSVLAALNGIKQLEIGPSAGEQRFLDEGGNITHILFGRLRVFSFYSDAGQFGASQAHIGLISLILALGPFKIWKRILLFIAAALCIYGMLISGTRGALFCLVVGVFLSIVLSKNFKVMIIGGLIALSFLVVLKYTYIGNSNYQIYRLRTAFDPKEASFNLRLSNQLILKEYLSSRPFGGGLGVIGVWGLEYNRDKFLSTIAPDSYWVKVWAMYGMVGFILWFGIMMYILGKCCGIVWNLKNEGLKVKAIALTSGYAGILFCSYGNEVINTAPSSFVVYVSLVFVFLSPKLEKELKKRDESLNLNLD